MLPQTTYDLSSEQLPPGGGLTTHKKHIKDFPGVLDVITCISNPQRYRSRFDLYRAFARRMAAAGCRLTTVECAFASRPFEITEEGNPNHVRVRNRDELWLKENLLQLGINHACQNYKGVKYIAWVDADVDFTRPDFVQETIHQLQHYAFVQMWSHAIDLGPRYEPMERHVSFAYCYLNPDLVPPLDGPGGDPYGPYGPYGPRPTQFYWHPGFCWAARREALDAVGGLMEFPILGAADQHMSKALIGRVTEAVAPGIHPNYLLLLNQWQGRAERYIRRNIGYVEGTIHHAFHGPKANRRYWDRWKILVKNQYNPLKDIKKNSAGVLELHDDGSPRSIRLRDDLRRYFRDRDEDSTYVPDVAN